MKHCPYCGKELPTEMQFCPYCMKKLITEQPIVSAASKRMGHWVAVVAIVAAVAVAGVLIGSFVLGQHDLTNDPSPDDETRRTTTTVTTSTNNGGEAITTGTATTVANGVASTSTTQNGVVTTKGNVGTTQTTNSGAVQGGNTGNACASGHSWRTITETVQHDEVGHYEQVVVRYNTVMVYKCALCHNPFDSLAEYYTHFDEEEAPLSDQLVIVFRELYETSNKQVPVYGQKWVVDEKAYTEQVVVGYECRVCGATK